MMSSSCKHKQKQIKGKLNVEIRYFESKQEKEDIDEFFIEENECSLCFVEHVNNIRKMHTNKMTGYFHPPSVYSISIPTPSSYEELQQLLATVIPKNYGPAIIERPDGSQIIPGSCMFADGETIVFREICPSSIKDFDIQSCHKKFKDRDMYTSTSHESLSKPIR